METVTISPLTLILISTGSALLGVLITSVFNLLTARMSKASEERKHQKELVFKAAIENWKQTYELMKASGLPAKMPPLDVFLFHMVALSDVVFDPTTSASNLKQRMAEVDKVTAIASSTSGELKKA